MIIILMPLNALAIDTGSVSVSPNEANRFGRYVIDFNTAITGGLALVFVGPQNNLRSGVDDVILTFDPSYELPASIDPSDVTVNGIQASDVQISGNVVTVTVGGDVSEGAVQVVFSTAAQIRNPETVASYSLTIETSREAGSTNDTYNIVAATSTITSASVIPTPSVADTTAAYDIAFRLGASGRVTSTSTITLEFPAEANVPDGFLTGVTLNGVATTAIATSGSVVVNVPVTVDNDELVSINFTAGVGITNPEAGTYSLDIFTSTETTPVSSDDFFISAPTQLSFSTIIMSDNTANAVSSYQVQFITSTSGFKDLEFSGTPDQIVISFPSQTILPDAIDPANITIDAEGFTDNPASAQVSGLDVILGVPFTIDKGEEVTITFSTGVGIQNPAEPGNYSLMAGTRTSALTPIDAAVSSNPYPISTPPTQITTPSIVTTSNAPGATADYTFTFQTGLQGRLIESVSTVSLVVPTGYGGTVSSEINGVAATGSVSGGIYTVTIPAGVSIGSGETVTWDVSNITNPAAGTYTFEMYTSVEPSPVNSQNVYIGNGSFTISAFSKSEADANLASEYDFDFTGMTFSADGSLFGSGGSRYVQFNFPEGTVLPSSMDIDDVTSNLTGNITEDYITVNTSTRVVRFYYTVTTSLFGAQPRVNSITFPASLNILNPSVLGATYTVGVSSSEEALTIPTSVYSITAGADAITLNSVSASPSLINTTNATISVNLTTSANGRLMGGTEFGSNIIEIDFGNGVDIPASISAGAVTINGASSGGVNVVSSGVGGQVEITIPNGVTYASSTTLNIVFTSTAQMDLTANVTSAVVVNSDVDAGTDSQNLVLSSTAPFEVQSVVVSPNQTNGSGAYTVRFSTSSTDGLSASDEVDITFPTNTFVPSAVGASLLRVNGIQPLVAASGSGQTLTIEVPADISTASVVTIAINSGAGVLNPSTPATTYTLDVTTPTDSDTSPQYAIVTGSSSMGTPSVSITDISPAATTNYTISAVTGSFGRLSADEGTITLTFPSGTDVSGATASVDGSPATINSASATTIEIETPVDIGNNDSFSITLTGVDNPVLGSYTFTIRSSSETTNVTSSTYNINTNTPIVVQSTTVADMIVNGPSDVDFTIQTDGTSGLLDGSGRIYIIFPAGTQFPLSIAGALVTVDGVASTSVSVNPLTRIVTIDPAQASIAAGSTFTISLDATTNILTPSEPGNYTYTLYTSAQLAAAQSQSIEFLASNITTVSADASSVAVSPQTAVDPVNWTWSFTTGARGAIRGGVGEIVLNFGNSVFTSAVTTSNVKVNGSNAASVNRAGNLVTITIPSNVTINNNTAVLVQISSGAGVKVSPDLALKKAPKRAPTEEHPFGSIEISALDEYQVYSSPEPTPILLESNPLPITLSFLEAQEIDGVVFVSWETSTEESNYGFYVERRKISDERELDEPIPSDNWEELGFIEGAGTTFETQTYAFEDHTAVEAGVYYFRIRQIDYNGDSEIFGPVQVTLNAPEKNELKNNFPNPFNPTTTIPFSVAQTGKVSINIYDLTGRLVTTLVNSDYNPGRYEVRWDARAMASGMYILSFRVDGDISHKMITLLK